MSDPKTLRVCSPQMSLTLDNNYGGGIFHLKVLESLAQAGVSCLIPLAFSPKHERRENWDVRVFPVRRTYKLGAIISNAVFFVQLVWLWFGRGKRFEILRVTDPYYVGPAALLFRSLTGVTLIANVFHIESNEYLRNAVLRLVCRQSNAVIVTSRFSKRQVTKALALDASRVFVTYGGVTEFEGGPAGKAEAKKALGLTGRSVIGFIGALSERKNPGFLLEIFADLYVLDKKRHLIFVGSDISADSTLMTRLKERARGLGIENAVTFTGRVNTEKKAVILKAMDLFVFPSLLEGFGLAVVEAMAAGVPAVVSDRGSLPEVVRHGEDGLVLSLADRAIFTRTISDLLEDGDRLQAMSQRARDSVRRDFSWEACAAETIDIHHRVYERTRKKDLGVILNSGDGPERMRMEGQLSRFEEQYLPRWSREFEAVGIFGYGAEGGSPAPNAEYIPGHPGLRGVIYGFLMPIVHRDRFRRLRLMRVMQAGAALPAPVAHFLCRIPFVVT